VADKKREEELCNIYVVYISEIRLVESFSSHNIGPSLVGVENCLKEETARRIDFSVIHQFLENK
jgi:hypothetical protein